MLCKYLDLKKNINKNTNFYLFYGSNQGLIEETITNVLKPISKAKAILKFDEEDVIVNRKNFEEKIFNKSFFDEEKLIIINRVSDKILNLIKDIINKKFSEIIILLKSGNLDKKSKIRNFFEKEKNTICVPFYADNNQTLATLALNFFNEKKIKISRESINLLVERANGDRIFLKNELEKINNFSFKKTNVNYKDLLKLSNLSENHEISKIVDNCLSKDKKTIYMLNENILNEGDNILILRTFLSKLKRLKILKLRSKNNDDINKILLTFKPTIFWKDKDIIKQQLKKLSLSEINILYKKINHLEILVKKNLQISSQLINSFILETCKN
jgi:DNA polymerase-3 subunit delta